MPLLPRSNSIVKLLPPVRALFPPVNDILRSRMWVEPPSGNPPPTDPHDRTRAGSAMTPAPLASGTFHAARLSANGLPPRMTPSPPIQRWRPIKPHFQSLTNYPSFFSLLPPDGGRPYIQPQQELVAPSCPSRELLISVRRRSRPLHFSVRLSTS